MSIPMIASLIAFGCIYQSGHAFVTPPLLSGSQHTRALSRIQLSELSATPPTLNKTEEIVDTKDFDLWQTNIDILGNPYRSSALFPATKLGDEKWGKYLEDLRKTTKETGTFVDPFWEQIKLEAQAALRPEPQAGPQLYQGILSQPSLMSSICSVISHEIETELIPATAIKNLFLELITPEDECFIRHDLEAVATRSPSVENAMDAALFHNGFHALVCYRVGHELWQANRTGLAYYMQSTVSRTYSADIHPACVLGKGAYVRVGSGLVIGETAVVGNDVSILEGVTLGGTGKESGDRHPKVADGVIIQDGGTVLGNIRVGEGSVVTAKSILTKPTPPLAIVSGVPAKIQSFRVLTPEAFDDALQKHLVHKYLDHWKDLAANSKDGQ